MMSKKTKVITGPEVLLNFPYLLHPRAISNSDPKYSTCLIIAKSDTKTLSAIKTALDATYEVAKAKYCCEGASIPEIDAFKSPIHDGDLEHPDIPVYENTWFINASSKYQPGIVDLQLNKVNDPGRIRSGVYCRASISFYPYCFNGNYGFGCNLHNIQLTDESSPIFDSHSSAEADFADFRNC